MHTVTFSFLLLCCLVLFVSAGTCEQLPTAASLKELIDKPAVHRFLLISLKLAEEAALRGEKTCVISFDPYSRKMILHTYMMYRELLTLGLDETEPSGWFDFLTLSSHVKWVNPEDETYYVGKMEEMGYTYSTGVTVIGYGIGYPYITLGWST